MTMMCPECSAELNAQSRYCNQCGAALGSICPTCEHRNDRNARFCANCGGKLSGDGHFNEHGPSRRAATSATVERRQLTVMFCDLVGSTERSTRMDVEDLQEVIGTYHAAVSDIVARYDGHVAQYLGDGVLIYFGYPRAHEKDAARALQTALMVVHEVAKLSLHGQKLEVRVGIATGSVMVGPIIGSAQSKEEAAIGETPNLAARLQALAMPNTIVTDRQTRMLAGNEFTFRSLGLHELKGFRNPIEAWELVRLLPEHRRQSADQARPALVGRALELAQLTAILDACRTVGQGRAVALRGEAGIGKSRLLEAFIEVAVERGFECHVGRALDIAASEEGDVVARLVRNLLGLTATSKNVDVAAALDVALRQRLVEPGDLVVLADLMGTIRSQELRSTYEAIDNATREQRRCSAIARLLESASGQKPRVVAVEDAHWATPTTLACLASLAATAVASPVVVVITTRPDADPLDSKWRLAANSAPLIAIDLAPLRAQEAIALSAQFKHLMDDVVRQCIERSAGNPLFLEQLLINASEGLATTIPSSIRSIVQARLDRLSSVDRAALQAASVLGQSFDAAAFACVSDQPGYDTSKLEHRLVLYRQGEGYRFAHVLLQEAVYESILRARRRELHLRAAAWFKKSDLALAAFHLDRAGDGTAAIAYLEAARGQVAAYRHDSARSLAERGVHIATNPNDRAALLQLLADVLIELNDASAALKLCQDAVAEVVDPTMVCRMLIRAARAKRLLDDLDGAKADLDRAQGLATTLDLKAEEAEITHLRGNLCFPLGDIEGCLREHGLSLQLAKEVGAAGLEAAALGGLGDAEYLRGRIISAYRHYRDSIDLAVQHSLPKIEVANRPMAAFTRWFSGDGRQAASEAQAAIEAAQRVGHLRAQMIGHHAAYLCLSSADELAAAFEHAQSALVIARQIKAPRFEAEGLAFRAQVQSASGQLQTARADIEEALVIARRTGLAFFGPVIFGIKASLMDDPAAKRAALSEAETVLVGGAASHNHLLFRALAIDVCWILGDWSEIERQADRLEDYTRGEPLPWADFHIRRARLIAQVGAKGCDTPLRATAERIIQLGIAQGHLRAAEAMRQSLGCSTALGSIQR